MRFVQSKKQWLLRLTNGWEVDYLSKLPEDLWVPFRYIDESSPAGVIHVGTLTVCMYEGHIFDAHRTLILQCPFEREPLKKTRSIPTPTAVYEVVEDFL